MPDLSQSNWSETDGGNNSASPNGAPEGMAPSGVNDTIRMMMGGTKRFWDRINGTLDSSAAGANHYSLGYTVAPAALVNGERYTFIAHQTNTGPATANVGVGANKPIRRWDHNGIKTLTSSDILAGMPVELMYDASLDVFQLLTPPSPTIFQNLQSLSNTISVMAATIAGLAIGSASAAAALQQLSLSVSALNTDVSTLSLSVSALNTIVTAGIAAIDSISNTISIIALAFPAADRSISLVLQANIASVSAIATAIGASVSAVATAIARSTSFVIKTDIASVSSVITTAFVAADRSTSLAIETRVNALSNTLQNQINTFAVGTATALADLARLSLSVSDLNSSVASLVAQGNSISQTVSFIWARFVSLTLAVDVRINDLSQTISTIVASKIPSVSAALQASILSVSAQATAIARSTSAAIYAKVAGVGGDLRSLSTVIGAQVNATSATLAGLINAVSDSLSIVKGNVSAISVSVVTQAGQIASLSNQIVHVRYGSKVITAANWTGGLRNGINVIGAVITLTSSFTTGIITAVAINGDAAALSINRFIAVEPPGVTDRFNVFVSSLTTGTFRINWFAAGN